MKVQIQKKSAFLRTSQSYTREALGGSKPKTKLRVQAKSKSLLASWLKTSQNWLLNGVIVSVVAVLLLMVTPGIYYALAPAQAKTMPASTWGTPLGGDFELGTRVTTQIVKEYQPETDATLPEGRWIVIPRIGVRTELHETETADEALNKGVWMVPGYGQPGDRSKPMIVAAHRYGWKWMWQSDYWKYHTFYLLPELEPGDTVEIISDHKKWVYEIYAGEEAEEISDYQADLILYTCKLLNSPVRHLRYARLIDPTRPTQ